MRQNQLIRILPAIVTVCCVATAVADDSQEHALRAMKAWSAFECSALASMNKDTAEQERLFLFGLDQGRKFIAAYQARKIKQEHLSNAAPWGFLVLLQGPTPDFMLGRIFESAQENALEDIFKTGDEFNPDEVQRILARSKFSKLNCQLIGK